MMVNFKSHSNQNPQFIQQFIHFFTKKINVLVIDDDKDMCKLLCNDVFLSPLFRLQHATNLSDAHNLIREPGNKWHSWIIDINLKSEKDGSSLLETFPNFNFAIVFSGMSTLETASNAIKKGALTAFSKDPALLFSSDAFYNEVCRVSALSFVLKGQHVSNMDIFKPLLDNFIESVDSWANCVNLTTRHLQRICSLYTSLTPRALLHLYHSLYYTLRDPAFTEQFDETTSEDLHIEKRKDFYYDCISSVVEKLEDTYRNEFLN